MTRQALHVSQLSEAEIDAISNAKPPEEAARFDDEVEDLADEPNQNGVLYGSMIGHSSARLRAVHDFGPADWQLIARLPLTPDQLKLFENVAYEQGKRDQARWLRRQGLKAVFIGFGVCWLFLFLLGWWR